jgi:thiol-disulfide isomerase/thioredoxin
MGKQKLLVVGIVILTWMAAAFWAPAAVQQAGGARNPNAFEKFRGGEIQKFKEFLVQLDAEMKAKQREFGKEMASRFEKFRDSNEGTSYAVEANLEIIAIAVHLLDDVKKVRETIATVKNPERACRLRLDAAMMYNQRGPNEETGKLIREVLAETKDKHPELYKEAERTGLRIAPRGMMFPEFPAATKDLDGKEIKFADYKGKVVLVFFWATWCGPCMREMPNIVRAYEKYHPNGFEIIGISLDESKQDLLKVTKDKRMTWREYFDGLRWENKVSEYYGVTATPTMYLVGPDGKIVTDDLLEGKLEIELGKLYPEKK